VAHLDRRSLGNWLYLHWVAAALFAGLLLLMLVPVIGLPADSFLLLIFLTSPVYMLHQVEEHTGDRFRQYVNRHVCGGLDALTPAAVLWINLPGVWGITVLSLYAATFVGPGWGLSAVYLVVVNGVIHILGAVAARAYNPGLYTAIILFLPLGGYTLWRASAMGSITWVHHAVGLGVALAIHVAIVVHVRLRTAALAAAAVEPGAAHGMPS
jgi:Protein of unknown function with HXXEE motif